MRRRKLMLREEALRAGCLVSGWSPSASSQCAASEVVLHVEWTDTRCRCCLKQRREQQVGGQPHLELERLQLEASAFLLVLMTIEVHGWGGTG